MNDNSLTVTTNAKLAPAERLAALELEPVLDAWTLATSQNGPRVATVRRDKKRAVVDFVGAAGVEPWLALEDDVLSWQEDMRERGLADSTRYKRHGDVARFWQWLKEHDVLEEAMPAQSPFANTRPKPPAAYKDSRPLSEDAVKLLLATVREEANAGKLTAKRDLAVLYFFLKTGKRRAEVLRLTWQDVERLNGQTAVHFRVKGGDTETRIIDSRIHELLIDYLAAAGRLEDMEADAPLWTGHDRAGQASGALSSHAFAKNLARYWKTAGLTGRVHIHALRHTVADALYQRTGDIGAVQYQLGHKNQQTSRIYVHSIATKPDKYGSLLDDAFGL
jgi:integrase